MKRLLLVLSAPSGGGKTTIAKKLLQVRKRPRLLGFGHDPRHAERRAGRSGLPLPEPGGVRAAQGRARVSRVGRVRRSALRDPEATRSSGILRRDATRCSTSISRARGRSGRISPTRFRCSCLPPSAEVLMERLTGRNTENPELLRKRLTRASDELAAVAEYDYAIVNEDLSHGGGRGIGHPGREGGRSAGISAAGSAGADRAAAAGCGARRRRRFEADRSPSR